MPETPLARARSVLAAAPVLDGHNDLAWAMREAVDQHVLDQHDPDPYHLDSVDLGAHVPAFHTDLPRLAAGGVGAQFWSVYVPSTLPEPLAVVQTLEQIDFVRRLAARYPDRLVLAGTAAEVRAAFASKRVACLLGAEGGHSIASSLPVLRMLHALGVRYLTLTHNDNTPWADSAADEPVHGGLTDLGRVVVREMNRIGMLVDLSHVAVSTMRDALDISTRPVIFSHSSARALCDHPRNVPDEILARLPGNGGVAMVTFVPKFVSQQVADWAQRAAQSEAYEREHPRPEATLAQVADHVEHVRQVAGLAHVGLGGDYDGCLRLPVGLEDVSHYPDLLGCLLERGWSEGECAALTSGNILRVLEDATPAG